MSHYSIPSTQQTIGNFHRTGVQHCKSHSHLLDIFVATYIKKGFVISALDTEFLGCINFVNKPSEWQSSISLPLISLLFLCNQSILYLSLSLYFADLFILASVFPQLWHLGPLFPIILFNPTIVYIYRFSSVKRHGFFFKKKLQMLYLILIYQPQWDPCSFWTSFHWITWMNFIWKTAKVHSLIFPACLWKCPLGILQKWHNRKVKEKEQVLFSTRCESAI